MNSESFIQSLIEDVRLILNKVEKLKFYELDTLTWRESEKSWNILECLEHLNLYGQFYLPQIEQEIKNSNSKNDIQFKSGLLGGYLAKSILPKNKTNKIKTFKNKNPLNANLNKDVIYKFTHQQISLLDLLNQSRYVSLNKIKIQTSISCVLRLRLGDTFQFFINHIIRHLNQISRIEGTIQASQC